MDSIGTTHASGRLRQHHSALLTPRRGTAPPAPAPTGGGRGRGRGPHQHPQPAPPVPLRRACAVPSVRAAPGEVVGMQESRFRRPPTGPVPIRRHQERRAPPSSPPPPPRRRDATSPPRPAVLPAMRRGPPPRPHPTSKGRAGSCDDPAAPTSTAPIPAFASAPAPQSTNGRSRHTGAPSCESSGAQLERAMQRHHHPAAFVYNARRLSALRKHPGHAISSPGPHGGVTRSCWLLSAAAPPSVGLAWGSPEVGAQSLWKPLPNS